MTIAAELHVRRDTIPNLALCLAVFCGPLVPAIARLAHPAPWLACAAMFTTLQTQPAIARGEMLARDATDRRSALAILIAVLVTQVSAVIEYGYAPWAARAIDLRLAGAVGIVALGLALRVWSIHTLGTLFTSTVRVRAGHAVVTTGPYRWVRHPSYTGALMIALGVTAMLGAPVATMIAVVVATPSYLYRISVEEAALTRVLGDRYTSYAARTRRLIPWLF